MKKYLILLLGINLVPIISTITACENQAANQSVKTFDIYNGDLWRKISNTEDQLLVPNEDGKIRFKVIHYTAWDDFTPFGQSNYYTETYTNRFENIYLINITIHEKWNQQQINDYKKNN